jgi:hypothetical protein
LRKYHSKRTVTKKHYTCATSPAISTFSPRSTSSVHARKHVLYQDGYVTFQNFSP